LDRQANINSTELKKSWESLYLLEVLVVKEDYGWEDRENGN
jgi:hypothetical protein